MKLQTHNEEERKRIREPSEMMAREKAWNSRQLLLLLTAVAAFTAHAKLLPAENAIDEKREAVLKQVHELLDQEMSLLRQEQRGGAADGGGRRFATHQMRMLRRRASAQDPGPPEPGLSPEDEAKASGTVLTSTPAPMAPPAAAASSACEDKIKAAFRDARGKAEGLTGALASLLSGANVPAEGGAPPIITGPVEPPTKTFEGEEAIESWADDLQAPVESGYGRIIYVVRWPYFKISFVILKKRVGGSDGDGGGGTFKYNLYLTSCPIKLADWLSGDASKLPTLAGGEQLLASLAGAKEADFAELDSGLLSRLRIISKEIRHSAGAAGDGTATPALDEAAFGLFGVKPEEAAVKQHKLPPIAEAFPSVTSYPVKDRQVCEARAATVGVSFKAV